MKPEPVGWETDAEWELEMRCANITENTPFAEVSKLINDLWQQYCLAAEPKPEVREGVDRQDHHSKPVVSQNTQIVEDKATEGGAHEKGWLPIETAPTDGTSILATFWLWNEPEKGRGMEVVSWDGEAWSSDAYPIYPPTHWMPLPSPPALTAKSEGGAHEKGIEAASKALGHEGVYISDATLKRAIAAYRAALTAKQTDGREGE